ncbi:MAG TPA: hypothetical protein VFZ73_15110 [Gemmatimonadaceae bacterium]
MKLVTTLSTAVLVAASAAALPAQREERTPDASLVRRADSITVGDYCRLAQRLVNDTSVVAALADDSGSARTSAAVICNPLLSSFSLLALTGRSPAPLRAVARVNNIVDRRVQAEIFEAMEEFRADTRRPELRATVNSALGADSNAFVRVTETARGLVLVTARDNALRRLANYERKLGPASPKLNFPEVLLNYAAQRWIPGFKPTPLGGPSPWEVIASYTPGYVTFDDDESGVLPVSASEFGLRFYLFGDRFGRPGLSGWLLPGYFSFGVITASDRNGALVWPWRGRERSGAFVSWGAIKIGYIDRERGTWLFSRQFQAVPFLF